MKLLSYLSCFCAVEGIVFGMVALVLDSRSALNRIAAAASFAYTVWAVGMTFAYGSENADVAESFYQASFVGSLFVPPLLVWLYLLFADGSVFVRRVWVTLSFAYSAVILLHYETSGFYYTSFQDGEWGNIGVASEHWFWATVSPYVHTGQIVAAILVWERLSRRRSERERRQLRLLVPGVLVSVAIYFMTWMAETLWRVPNVSVLAGAVLVSVTFLLIARYRHLRSDRPLLEHHLFHVSQESGFLLDIHGRILGLNEPALRRLGTDEVATVGREFRELFDDSALLNREWRLVTAHQSLHRRLLVSLSGHTVAVTLTARFDEFQDLVSVGALVGDLPGFDARAAEWGVTSREKQVLLLAVQESPMAEIADTLGISPATVKTHLHHLFEKTGCANRAELFGRLLGAPAPLSP